MSKWQYWINGLFSEPAIYAANIERMKAQVLTENKITYTNEASLFFAEIRFNKCPFDMKRTS